MIRTPSAVMLTRLLPERPMSGPSCSSPAANSFSPVGSTCSEKAPSIRKKFATFRTAVAWIVTLNVRNLRLIGCVGSPVSTAKPSVPKLATKSIAEPPLIRPAPRFSCTSNVPVSVTPGMWTRPNDLMSRSIATKTDGFDDSTSVPTNRPRLRSVIWIPIAVVLRFVPVLSRTYGPLIPMKALTCDAPIVIVVRCAVLPSLSVTSFCGPRLNAMLPCSVITPKTSLLSSNIFSIG